MPDAALDPSQADTWRWIAAAGVTSLGALITVLGAWGLARQPDVYARAHAAAVLDGPGVLVMVAGLALAAWDWRAAGLLMVLALLRVWTGPRTLRAILSAALAIGETPRPGSRSDDPPPTGAA
jgi:multicomponent Na+:H+ antiporter subunit G